MAENVQCPVCTLYLHAGMNLSDHLETHPKEQVIKALVQMTISGASSAATSALASALVAESKPKVEEKALPDKEEESNSASCASSVQSSTTSSNKTVSTLATTLSYAADDNSVNTLSSGMTNVTTTVNASAANTNSNQSHQPKQQPSNHMSNNPASYQRFVNENVSKKTNASSAAVPIALATAASASASAAVMTKTNEHTILPRDFSNRNFSNVNRYHQQITQQQPQQMQQAQQHASATSQLHTQLQQQQNTQTQYTQQHKAHNQQQQPVALHAKANVQQQPAAHQHQQQQQNCATLPPPPPPPPAPAPTAAPAVPPNQFSMNSSFASLQLQQHNQQQQQQQQQHALALAHQRQQQMLQQQHQQQQQQNQKVIYSPALPPPPPLQLFTYHNSQQQQQTQHTHHQLPQQHQRPPPAYGTAISQIRSQHKQQHQQQQQHHANAASLPAQHQQQAQAQSINFSNPHQQLRMTAANVPQHGAALTDGQHGAAQLRQHAPQGGKYFSQQAFHATENVAHQQSEQQQQQHNTHHAQHTQKQQSVQQSYGADYQQVQPHHTHPAPAVSTNHHHTHHKTYSSLSRQNLAAMNLQQAAQPANLSCQNSNNNNGSSTSSQNSRTSSSFSAIRSAAVAAPSPAASVLRYAESPVAHYLERENGDFIVQETPKHIVECVEKDNGEFSVIERIYHSPPSVLHIHEEEVEDDDEIRDQKTTSVADHERKAMDLHEKMSSSASKATTDEDEFMSGADSDIDCSSSVSASGSVAHKKHKKQRKNSATSKLRDQHLVDKDAGLNMEPTTSAAAISNSTQADTDGSAAKLSTDNNGNATTSNNTRKRTSKNTVTVLSDVQLNLNEYLDLVGNIIASSKSQRSRLSALTPMALVKIEKEEPMDEYDDEQPQKSEAATTCDTQQADDASATKSCNIETENFITKNDEPTSEITAHTNMETPGDDCKAAANNSTEFAGYNAKLTAASNSSHFTTSVIRMASATANGQQQQATTTEQRVDEQVDATAEQRDCNIAEDLSQPQLKSEIETHPTELTTTKIPKAAMIRGGRITKNNTQVASIASSSLLPPKKGPKKLVIKPKSTAKTDTNAKVGSATIPTISSSTTTTTANSNHSQTPNNSTDLTNASTDNARLDELPTTSAMAKSQMGAQQQQATDATNPLPLNNIVIKNEPIHSVSYESTAPASATSPAASILEQQLKYGTANAAAQAAAVNEDIACKEEKPQIQEMTMNLYQNVADAEVLLQLANSKHKQPTPATTDNSSNSNYTHASMDDDADCSSTETPKKVVASARYALPTTASPTADEASMSLQSSAPSANAAGELSEEVQGIIISSSSYTLQPDENEHSNSNVADASSSSASKSISTGAAIAGETTQKQQQMSGTHSQAPHNFAEYPFTFLYNQQHGGVASNSNSNSLPPASNFHYQHANEATNAATLATSSALSTSSVSNAGENLDDSTSMPMPANAAMHTHFSNTSHVTATTTHTWYQQQQHQQANNHHQHAHGHAHSQHQQPQHHDFNALAVDCSAAVDSGDMVGRYLDLDACKREIVVGSNNNSNTTTSTTNTNVHAHATSTSSSFTAAGGDSSLAGGCTTDALNIRTDEKMPAKGEISEQESNCDIENSWSQPMYGDLSARFFRTTFPGIFPHDNGCWAQDDYFDVQDLSTSTLADANNRANKSFDFGLAQEATTSANAMGQVNRNMQLFSQHAELLMPSTSTAATSATNKKKRKRDSGAHTQPTSTITSQQLLLQQQQQQHMQMQALQFQHPTSSATTSSSTIMAGPLNASNVHIPPSAAQAKARKKVYQCPHCALIFTKLKDRNTHLIMAHNYVRQNRRLICTEQATTALEPHSSAAVAMPLIAAQQTQVEESKEGIVKIKMEQSAEQQQQESAEALDAECNDLHAGGLVTTKAEPLPDDNALVPYDASAATAMETDAYDAKPNIKTLAIMTPATKLAAIYRMLVSFNASVLKQNQTLNDLDEKVIESSIFFCYVCRTNFSSVKLYDAHLTEHAAECFTCGKKFQRWKNFSLHLKRHMGWKEFACNVCDKKFVVRNALVEHLRTHTGQTPLKCKICGKHFKRYSNLTQHRKRHTKQVVRKKEYVCHCGEVLPSKARYRWHKETHDSKPKCCPHCCDRFVHMNSLRRHIRLAHSDKFDYAEPMECPMCKQVFAKTSIKAHMATHSMDAQFSCAICNKTFSTKWNLKIHSWVHANRTAKPFKCEHCPKAFVRELDFKNHMNAHKQIKPYTCEYCGCKFIRKYNYMRHRREHHGKKKFTCDCCDKSFHRHYYLIEHRRIHTGERPFQCTICGKSSTTKTNHNKHLKIHHSRDPFTVEA